MKHKITIIYRVVLSFLFVTLLLSSCTPAVEQVSQTGYAPRVFSAGDMTRAELAEAVLVVEDIPSTLTADILEANGSVNRLYEQETKLNSVLYQNRDGSKTEYIFAADVKYLDADGEIRDKSLSLSNAISKADYREKFSFAVEDNDTRVYFPANLNHTVGVVLEKDDICIELRPLSTISTAQEGKMTNRDMGGGSTQQVIEYLGILGSETTLRYTPVLNGYKEDLILYSKPATNRFSFTLSTGGLEAVIAQDGSISLLAPDTKDIVGEVERIYVYDSGELIHETFENHYEITKIADGEYTITMVVDEEFLNDPNIVYPVIVDPTVKTVNVGTSTSDITSAIDDTILYSAKPTRNYADNYYGNVGYVDSSYGVGYMLVKFPGFSNTAPYNNSTYTITSATYYVYKVGGSNGESATVTAYAYAGNTWEEDTATYTSIAPTTSSNIGAVQDAVSMQSHTQYEFDITDIVSDWQRNSTLLNKGIILKNTTSTTNADKCRVLATSEYAVDKDSTKLPFLAVEYDYTAANVPNGTYYIKSVRSGHYFTRRTSDGKATQFAYAGGNKEQRWIVTKQDSVNNYYRISPASNSSLALTVNGGSSANSAAITTTTWTGADSQLWQFICYSDGSYSLVSKCSNGEKAIALNYSTSLEEDSLIVQYANKGGAHYRWELSSPSLSVTGVSLSSSNLLEGQSVTITPTIKHSGTGTIPPITTRIKVTDPSGTVVLNTTSTSANLTSGATFKPSVTLNSLVNGTYSYIITADINGITTITKSDTFVVLKKPDLTVAEIYSPNSNAFVQTSYPICIREENINSTAGNRKLALSIKNANGYEVYSCTFDRSSLSAANSYTTYATWTPSVAGTYTITATTDSTNLVEENDESNNVRSITVTVIDDNNETINDNQSGAYVFALDNNGDTANIVSMLYSTSDVDWYKVVVPEGKTFVEFFFNKPLTTNCDLKLYISSSSGTLTTIQSTFKTYSSNEYFREKTDGNETIYYFCVEKASAALSYYSLDVRVR